jgi:ADP-heptose:LPS heptosyltransferase
MLKRAWKKWGPNPFERLLKKAEAQGKKRFLIVWNRGLGDIALGLYALTFRLREVIPNAEITFLTREDLREGFSLLQDVHVLSSTSLKRGESCDLSTNLEKIGRKISDFDLLIEKPDPTHWVRWQLGKLTPKLKWENSWDELSSSFGFDENSDYIGLQPQTETEYGYEKNWPMSYWNELIEHFTKERGVKVVLFGKSRATFPVENTLDLRGKTNLFELLSIIKNRLKVLVVPDSGILSLTYFLDAKFPLKVISLWADPNQGVLKQNVPSPNSELVHVPLVAKDADLRNVSVSEVLHNVRD